MLQCVAVHARVSLAYDKHVYRMQVNVGIFNKLNMKITKLNMKKRVILFPKLNMKKRWQLVILFSDI